MLDESLVTGPGNDVGLVAGRSVRRRDYQCKWKRKQTDLQTWRISENIGLPD